MKFLKGEIAFELPDDWILEAGLSMANNIATHYPFDSAKFPNAFVIPISSIAPPKRNKGIPIFNSREIKGQLISARDRTVSILKGLFDGAVIDPVEVVGLEAMDKAYKFKLVDGMHRFHCSIAVGFISIPVVYGMDINDPDL